jgi:hypothetical protein
VIIGYRNQKANKEDGGSKGIQPISDSYQNTKFKTVTLHI